MFEATSHINTYLCSEADEKQGKTHLSKIDQLRRKDYMSSPCNAPPLCTDPDGGISIYMNLCIDLFTCSYELIYLHESMHQSIYMYRWISLSTCIYGSVYLHVSGLIYLHVHVSGLIYLHVHVSMDQSIYMYLWIDQYSCICVDLSTWNYGSVYLHVYMDRSIFHVWPYPTPT